MIAFVGLQMHCFCRTLGISIQYFRVSLNVIKPAFKLDGDNKILSSFRYGIIIKSLICVHVRVRVVGIVKAGCFELNVGLINTWKSCRVIIKQTLFEHWFVFVFWGTGSAHESGISTSCDTHRTSGITACLPKLRRQQCRCDTNIPTTLRNETQS